LQNNFLKINGVFIMRKLGLALLSEEMADVPTGESTVNGEDIASTEEVSSGGAELESDLGSMTEATDGVELVEQVKDVLEEAAEKGEGVDATAAELATLVSEHFRGRMGITGRSMPSLEAFGSASSRVAATNLALLSISDTVSRAWEAIKAFFKNIWEKIKAFYKKIFTATGRMKARSIALRTKAASLTGTTDETSFENSTFAHAYQDQNGKYAKANAVGTGNYIRNLAVHMVDFAKGVVNYTKLVENISAHNSAAQAGTTPILASMTAAIKGTGFEEKKGSDLTGLGYSEGGLRFTSMSHGAGQNDQLFVSKKAYYSGIRLVIELETDAESALGTKKASKNSYKGIKAAVSELIFDIKDTNNDDIDVDVLSKAEMAEVCKDVEDLAKANEMFSVVEKEIDNITKKINKLADQATKATTGPVDAAAGAIERKDFLALGGILQQCSVKLPALSIKTGNTSLNYVEKCMGYYKK
jgi:hypothetical protein